MRRRKLIRAAGTVLLNHTGRPENCYGPRRSGLFLDHDIWVTEAEYWLGQFVRNVKIGKAVADGMMTRKGTRMAIEVDNSSMSSHQLRAKFQLYAEANFDGFLLIVCHSRTRLRLVMRSAKLVRDYCLFSRFRWLASPVQAKWFDWKFSRIAI